MFARFDRHDRLMGRMADTLGVDLAEEAMHGRLGPEDLRSLLVRCTGCGQASACEGWLDAQSGQASLAPDYCRNKDQLERLARD
jgi:hypothetical protein